MAKVLSRYRKKDLFIFGATVRYLINDYSAYRMAVYCLSNHDVSWTFDEEMLCIETLILHSMYTSINVSADQIDQAFGDRIR